MPGPEQTTRAGHLEVTDEVAGPWSLATSKAFWEGFAPAALSEQTSSQIRTVFLAESDWRRVEAVVTQHGDEAHIALQGQAISMPPPPKYAASCPSTSTPGPGPMSAAETP